MIRGVVTTALAATVAASAQQIAGPTPPDPLTLARVGAAYAAKIIGSAVFVSGRSLASVLADEFAPETALNRQLRELLTVEVDREEQIVTCRIGPIARRAMFRPGFGCTLLLESSPEQLRAQVSGLPGSVTSPAPIPWPRPQPEDGQSSLDGAALQAALTDAFRNPLARTRAVVVVHRGRLLAERYARGFGPDTPLAGWSMAKSVLNALIGLRIRQGAMELDEPVSFAAWQPGDPRAEIVLRDLLQMRSGLSWTERYTDVSSDVPRMLFMEPSAGDYVGAQNLADAPGTRWSYSSGTSNLLSQVLRASFDDDLDYLSFPRRALFEPIGMTSAVLELDPSGTFLASSFLLATARDWARFGQLYAQNGVWQGQRLLPSGFVAASLVPVPDEPRGRYGMHWWLNRGSNSAGRDRPHPELPVDAFFANGYEGQVLAVIPSRELVIVRLGCTTDSQSWNEARFLGQVFAAFGR